MVGSRWCKTQVGVRGEGAYVVDLVFRLARAKTVFEFVYRYSRWCIIQPQMCMGGKEQDASMHQDQSHAVYIESGRWDTSRRLGQAKLCHPRRLWAVDPWPVPWEDDMKVESERCPDRVRVIEPGWSGGRC